MNLAPLVQLPSFLIYLLLRSSDVVKVSLSIECLLLSQVTLQLELEGHWEWSIFLYKFLAPFSGQEELRTSLLKDLISRHAPSLNDSRIVVPPPYRSLPFFPALTVVVVFERVICANVLDSGSQS